MKTNPLGRSKLPCTQIAFGSYRISGEFDLHEKALKLALDQGVRLIDTSSNYTDGQSEELIGRVLTDKMKQDVTLVTKAGYVQGQTLAICQKKEAQGQPYGEMVKLSDDLWHCMHPEFLLDQIEQSLSRMKLECLDVFLIHNPEYYFHSLAGQDYDIEKAQFTFYDRIRRAFAALEGEVEKGRIKHYGISSNTLTGDVAAPDSTNLETFWAIAEQIAIDDHKEPHEHHFSVIQFPLNLIELAGFANRNNSDKTCLEFAGEKNLGVLVNRPLNAMKDGKLLRLVEKEVRFKFPNVGNRLKEIANLESRFIVDFKDVMKPIIEKHGPPFKIGTHLKPEELGEISSEQWRVFSGTHLIGEIVQLTNSFDQIFRTSTLANDWAIWKSEYLDKLRLLVEEVLSQANDRENKLVEVYSQILKTSLYKEKSDWSLAQMATHVLTQIYGINSVLIGMRDPEYVNELTTMANSDFSLDQEEMSRILLKLYEA